MSIIRDRRRIWVGGIWRSLVPIVAIGGLYIGSQYYDPDGYVALARPHCSGLSEEGYSLRWQEVPVEGGGTEMQCVQFRPRMQVVGVTPPPPPPPQTLVTPPPEQPIVTGSCELTVYAEPNFAGMSAQATENQPNLEEAGWKNEIGSIQIKSGTWEFYAEDDFTGDAMRLPPGSHGNLAEWAKRIGSMMCIQPSGAPSAANDRGAFDWARYLAAGRPAAVVLDATKDKLNDEDPQASPLGTIKGGETYAIRYAANGWTASGYNKGTRQAGTWTYNAGRLDNREFNIWGHVFRFDDQGRVFDDKLGHVGRLVASQ